MNMAIAMTSFFLSLTYYNWFESLNCVQNYVYQVRSTFVPVKISTVFTLESFRSFPEFHQLSFMISDLGMLMESENIRLVVTRYIYMKEIEITREATRCVQVRICVQTPAWIVHSTWVFEYLAFKFLSKVYIF